MVKKGDIPSYIVRTLSREAEGLSPMKPGNRLKGSGANSCRMYPER